MTNRPELLDSVLELRGGQWDITFTGGTQDAIVAHVRVLLKAGKISQRDFATDIGMPEGMLSKILTGARKLHGEELVKMAEVLRKPIDYFLEGTGNGSRE